MTRVGSFARTLLVLAMLPAASAWAADPPEVLERKRQLSQVYQAAITYGGCEVYLDLDAWQKANWPDGAAVVQAFLREKILPQYVADPAVLKGMADHELILEYGKLCQQTQAHFYKVMDDLSK